jgi:hypothetical protein
MSDKKFNIVLSDAAPTLIAGIRRDENGGADPKIVFTLGGKDVLHVYEDGNYIVGDDNLRALGFQKYI